MTSSTHLDELALLLTPEAAASRLSVGRSKIYALMRTGELRSIKIGGSRRITMEALDEFIAQLEAAS